MTSQVAIYILAVTRENYVEFKNKSFEIKSIKLVR